MDVRGTMIEGMSVYTHRRSVLFGLLPEDPTLQGHIKVVHLARDLIRAKIEQAPLHVLIMSANHDTTYNRRLGKTEAPR
jgi:hypothetical protein